MKKKKKNHVANRNIGGGGGDRRFIDLTQSWWGRGAVAERVHTVAEH